MGGETDTSRREGRILRRMAGSVPCHREVKEDKKSEVAIAFESIEVISEMQTPLVQRLELVLGEAMLWDLSFVSWHHLPAYPVYGLLPSPLRLFSCQHLPLLFYLPCLSNSVNHTSPHPLNFFSFIYSFSKHLLITDSARPWGVKDANKSLSLNHGPVVAGDS